MRLSDLLGAEIVTAEGESLGHVQDVRVRRLERRTPDGHQLRVIGLVKGRTGFRERLGIDTSRTVEPVVARDVIEWERVEHLDLEAGRVVVRPA